MGWTEEGIGIVKSGGSRHLFPEDVGGEREKGQNEQIKGTSEGMSSAMHFSSWGCPLSIVLCYLDIC